MATPLVRLAPLDLIRGFVAVGRRMSVTLAAEDLCLTQSAVSRQIHSLEDALGVPLFHRGYRSISFTQAGERLFRTADSVVRQLQDAFETITRPAERQPVTVTASIGATALWLLPRLSELQRRYPELDVRVAANDKPLDLRTEGIDLALRYASAANPPPGAARLFDDTLIAVAHPSLALDRLDADALGRHALLEFDALRRPLARWSDHLAALGLSEARPRSILHFDQYDQVVQAALAGKGIALGTADLVQPLIDDGRLVALSAGKNRAGAYAYWIVQGEALARQEVRDVAQWLAEQARLPAPPAERPPVAGHSPRAAVSPCPPAATAVPPYLGASAAARASEAASAAERAALS
jgi:DNA-binding transcriptional LysR family regulator